MGLRGGGGRGGRGEKKEEVGSTALLHTFVLYNSLHELTLLRRERKERRKKRKQQYQLSAGCSRIPAPHSYIHRYHPSGGEEGRKGKKKKGVFLVDAGFEL